jgi:hypothetical protein
MIYWQYLCGEYSICEDGEPTTFPSLSALLIYCSSVYPDHELVEVTSDNWRILFEQGAFE